MKSLSIQHKIEFLKETCFDPIEVVYGWVKSDEIDLAEFKVLIKVIENEL